MRDIWPIPHCENTNLLNYYNTGSETDADANDRGKNPPERIP
jgi:hypothetical protein